MLLEANGISKRFGANQVLQQVGFTIRRGEVLGLIGPNGAGKTTLFECLAGLLPADAGSVTIDGRAVPATRRKHHLFYLPDGIRPWPAQTVGWALDFFAALHGAREVSRFRKALDLDPYRHARIGSLSKGESKRLLLALGLLSPQPLLLLDEPFDGLDFRQARDVMALLRTLPGEGRTLFLSIHQLTDAARVCDRLVLLSRGRVAAEGALPELRAKAGLAEGGLEEVFLALT
jgi:ABC-2 type transport system ATP-binding protein